MKARTMIPAVIAASLCCLIAIHPTSAKQPRQVSGGPARPTFPGGGYGGPGDTVPPEGSGGSGLPDEVPCPLDCPTFFSDSGCSVECDYEFPSDATVAAFGKCSPVSTVYDALSHSFTYRDWQDVELLISTGVIVPDSDGNITICTPLQGNVQEVYVLESERINGGGPNAECVNRFPEVEAEVWIYDEVHDTSQCGDGLKELERLHRGSFEFLLHCLSPPPSCSPAQVAITFNVECMTQAVDWWHTWYDGTSYELTESTWFFNVGMLTCTLSQSEH